jgi:surfeit locus 1 family protein
MQFRPTLALSLTLLIVSAVFGRLGWWQLERGEEKQKLFDQFAEAPLMTIEQALKQPDGFSRVEAWGRFDPQRHILLDNKIYKGRAGVHVYTPFYLENGDALLVNRGWLPMPPDRRRLPAIPTAPEKQMLSGLLKRPVTGGPRLGAPDELSTGDWPQLVTYFDLDAISQALDVPLAQWLLQLDRDDPAGFEDRQWQAAVMTPAVHRAYAWQWISLSLATLIIWVAIGFRRGQRRSKLQS